MRHLLVSFIILLTNPAIVLANDEDSHAEEGAEHVEESIGLVDQLQVLLPFRYIGEGQWLAAFVSIILWLALIYSIYYVVRGFVKK